jgi:hypothetical protein
VAVQVHRGNTADPTTVPDALEAVAGRFAIPAGYSRRRPGGDHPDPPAERLKDLVAGFVSARKTAQIRKLINGRREVPPERHVVCRNPHRAIASGLPPPADGHASLQRERHRSKGKGEANSPPPFPLRVHDVLTAVIAHANCGELRGFGRFTASLLKS